MWSSHVVPNNRTSCLTLEEQYHIYVMERKKNARGERCHAKHFRSENAPLYKFMKNKLFSDHFSWSRHMKDEGSSSPFTVFIPPYFEKDIRSNC